LRYCTGPDLDHSWIGSHEEGNFRRPNNMLESSRNQGFVRVNAQSDPPAQVTDHDTMGYYTNVDLPFYYDLAETFAISDRYFAAVIGQTFPNRAYFVAGTSFGHLTTDEIITAGGYKPINGTIYDRLDAAAVSWTDYFSDLPSSLIFATSHGHTKPVSAFAMDAAAGTLPAVAFVDSSAFADQTINGHLFETDEHPPSNIRAGEYFVSTIINALRNSQSWKDSVLFLTYDVHGGFYDHVAPPAAVQGGAPRGRLRQRGRRRRHAPTPDGIAPGQCADASNPPASEQPGGGVTCKHSRTLDAPGLCPAFTSTGPYPAYCATFNQLGFRLPFIAVSPFAKPHYVSHSVGSHTSLLALLEKRFSLPPLTSRDANASDLEDMFDFDNAPSATAVVGTAPLPAEPGDPNCPFNESPSGAFVDDTTRGRDTARSSTCDRFATVTPACPARSSPCPARPGDCHSLVPAYATTRLFPPHVRERCGSGVLTGALQATARPAAPPPLAHPGRTRTPAACASPAPASATPPPGTRRPSRSA